MTKGVYRLTCSVNLLDYDDHYHQIIKFPHYSIIKAIKKRIEQCFKGLQVTTSPWNEWAFSIVLTVWMHLSHLFFHTLVASLSSSHYTLLDFVSWCVYVCFSSVIVVSICHQVIWLQELVSTPIIFVICFICFLLNTSSKPKKKVFNV